MDKIIIEGGYKLSGEVHISGSKNAALPIIASSLLTSGENTFHNIPDLADVKTIKTLLKSMGVEIKGKETLQINAHALTHCEASYDLVKTMRASILVLGPLVARSGEARVSLPGGCAIGARPVNLHLKALKALGAEINLKDGYIEAKASRLQGTTLYFDIVTVTGTENIMMAATLAKGTTILENAAREPEIINLAQVLNAMGARIKGAGTDTIQIEGVEKLHPVEATVIPDRIEAGTYLIAAGLTGGSIMVLDCIPEHLDAVVVKLQEAGLSLKSFDRGIQATANCNIKSIDINTLVYPGFPTDLQAQAMALMTMGNGISVIKETVFENRFMHANELMRMGAHITIEGNSAIIKGIEKLRGAPVMATDLRASASLILAGLAAEDKTEVSRIYHIDRGYERIEAKLSSLGAHIKRINE